MGCRRSRTTSRRKFLTLVLDMLETWFWCQTPCFWVWGIIWDHLQKPQIDLNVTNGLQQVKDHLVEKAVVSGRAGVETELVKKKFGFGKGWG